MLKNRTRQIPAPIVNNIQIAYKLSSGGRGNKMAVLTSKTIIISAGIHNAIPSKLFFSTSFLLATIYKKAVARVMPNVRVRPQLSLQLFYVLFLLMISQPTYELYCLVYLLTNSPNCNLLLLNSRYLGKSRIP